MSSRGPSRSHGPALSGDPSSKKPPTEAQLREWWNANSDYSDRLEAKITELEAKLQMDEFDVGGWKRRVEQYKNLWEGEKATNASLASELKATRETLYATEERLKAAEEKLSYYQQNDSSAGLGGNRSGFGQRPSFFPQLPAQGTLLGEDRRLTAAESGFDFAQKLLEMSMKQGGVEEGAVPGKDDKKAKKDVKKTNKVRRRLFG